MDPAPPGSELIGGSLGVCGVTIDNEVFVSFKGGLVLRPLTMESDIVLFDTDSCAQTYLTLLLSHSQNTKMAEEQPPVSTSSSPLPNTALPKGYTLQSGYPPIPDYLHLRAATGLSPKTVAQAAPIPHGSWYGCYITYTPPPPSPNNTTTNTNINTTPSKPSIVAMGRVIGDGGWYFLIADMAVLPEHQRKGLGDAVLKQLLEHIRTHAPRDEDGGENGDGKSGGGAWPYVTLFADEPGRKLYKRNGFVESLPIGQMGMSLPKGWEKDRKV